MSEIREGEYDLVALGSTYAATVGHRVGGAPSTDGKTTGQICACSYNSSTESNLANLSFWSAKASVD